MARRALLCTYCMVGLLAMAVLAFVQHPGGLSPAQLLALVNLLVLGPAASWLSRGSRVVPALPATTAVVASVLVYGALWAAFPGYPEVGPSEHLAISCMLVPSVLTIGVTAYHARVVFGPLMLALTAALALGVALFFAPSDPVSRCVPVSWQPQHGRLGPRFLGFWGGGSMTLAMSPDEVNRFAECIEVRESASAGSGVRTWAVDVEEPLEGCVFEARYADGLMHVSLSCGYT